MIKETVDAVRLAELEGDKVIRFCVKLHVSLTVDTFLLPPAGSVSHPFAITKFYWKGSWLSMLLSPFTLYSKKDRVLLLPKRLQKDSALFSVNLSCFSLFQSRNLPTSSPVHSRHRARAF